ncbi:hypothetical protein P2R64_23615 [Priestia megaterium]|uniref:hypothetical protein n=1 Tax=Priestia megaterium TaxID=1404 RepID=UPI0021C2540D|nr:hypothetical protein [Priestia megaterium]MCT9852290.1 hypothetical protein [Priestia megaterium]MDF1963044.1 hypothetical protein [Priestia megaterium]
MDNKRVISLCLNNCYGIKSMKETIEFGNENNTSMIYASNGVMKTSLSKTLDRLSRGEYPKDEVFGKQTSFSVSYSNLVDHTNLPTTGTLENVFVIHSLDNTNDFAKSSSSLLVNEEARTKFIAIHKQINEAINAFKASLKKRLGTDCWGQLKAFIDRNIYQTKNDESLIISLSSFLENVNLNKYEKCKYKDLFNNHTDKLFNNSDFVKNVNEYTTLYNKLLSESEVFSEKGFDPQNADSILEQLKKTNFFEANHKVIFNNDETNIIKSEKEFKKILTEEKKRILSEDLIIEKFSGIEKLLSNANTRKFRDIIKANPEYIPLLVSRDTLEKDFWLYILNDFSEEVSVINKIIQENEKTLIKIREEALNDTTEWQKVVAEYNDRFHVPFELVISNKEDVILNLDLPIVDFKYKDNITGEETIKNYDSLQNILSNGEKRALYFLNIIFKIEALKKESEQKLLIFDDIADSFDYKNKYAIIQYIKEISNEQNFDVLILTHNYDFYRTLSSRIPINRENSFIARINNDNSVTFNNQNRGTETLYLGNIFKVWIKAFSSHKNEMIMTASITFFRNLLEYRYTKDTTHYDTLTSLLHIKKETNQITWNNILPIVQELVPELPKEAGSDALGNKLVIDSIFENADKAVRDSSSAQSNLENKVVLAMAIRLKAEKRALDILGLPYSDKKGNQTYELYKDVKKSGYSLSNGEREMFEQVMIMTPEHLHLNSFMFEPLIDTSIDSLIDLYEKCKNHQGEEAVTS